MKNQIKQIFIRLYHKSAKFNLELSKEKSEIIIGLMLGDLFAEKRNLNSNTRLQFKQSTKNQIYVDHLYNLFKEFCGSKPKIVSSFNKRADKNKNKNKITTAIKF
jgi:hypothetical protein